MKINQALETPQGTVLFQGELEPDEVAFVIQVGLNFLFREGALPIKSVESVDLATIAPGSQSAN